MVKQKSVRKAEVYMFEVHFGSGNIDRAGRVKLSTWYSLKLDELFYSWPSKCHFVSYKEIYVSRYNERDRWVYLAQKYNEDIFSIKI